MYARPAFRARVDFRATRAEPISEAGRPDSTPHRSPGLPFASLTDPTEASATLTAMSYTPRSHYPLWVGGQETPGSGPEITIENPATGETITMCASASAEDVAKAIQLGQETFKSGVWSKKAPADRAAIVSRGGA